MRDMDTTALHQDVAADKGVGSSTGLSLREKMRLKAQQRLHDQAAAAAAAAAPCSSSVSTRTNTTSFAAIDIDSDEEALGSLTLGRTKRQAALKRPATYSIDPLDDASRLKRDPNKLSISPAKYAATPIKKSKNIDSLLREQQRRIKRGTDAEGFLRAEAIAQSIEHERLGRMGIGYSDHDGDAYSQHRNPGESSKPSQLASVKVKRSNGNSTLTTQGNIGREPEPTVRALSPTIPSFLWSSQSEAGPSDEESDLELDSSVQKQRLAASLAAVSVDEDEKQQALDILRRDMRDRKHPTTKASKGQITFYKPGRTLAPEIAPNFCPLPSLTASKQESVASSPTEHLDWNTVSPHLLLAGIIPPSLDLDKRQVRRILVWAGISFILEQDVFQSQLLLAFFRSLISSATPHYRQQLQSAIPRALTDITRRIPLVLYQIGIHERVFKQCFRDNLTAANGACFTLAQHRPSSQTHARDGTSSSTSAEFKNFKVYVTQAERDEIVIRLAQMVSIITSASPTTTFVEEDLNALAGYVSSMAIACAASTNLELHGSVGDAFTNIFRAAREEGRVVEKLQEEVCQRTLSGLDDESIAIRARLVTVFPGEGKEVAAVQRFLAWLVLTEHVAADQAVADSPADAVASSDATMDAGEDLERIANVETSPYWERTPFQPLSLDLERLVRAVDPADHRSPFHIAVLTSDAVRQDDNTVESKSTDFATLIAATQLLALTLHDLALHLCTFRSTQHATDAAQPQTPLPRVLRQCLLSYTHLNPKLDPHRTAAIRTLIQKLLLINSKIRDNRADVILTSLAKDRLQRTAHSLEYQLQMLLGESLTASSFLK
ncbi:uncharacterized protein UTRI_02539 [Ustilago trichophora]|uniref:Uncharacterized protein n=1 Tax=Ustilago trichophora TaxID=86804 RepID=A0A5C3E6D2_9BASI|nr:uncharacterized protein UTRI_02539 [Ustilago trichophora]